MNVMQRVASGTFGFGAVAIFACESCYIVR